MGGAGRRGLFVLPSYSENFGVAAIEAMMFGVPVVVSDQVAIYKEVVSAGAGIVTRCDARAIEDAMAALLDHPDARRLFGARGIRMASEHSLWGKSVVCSSTFITMPEPLPIQNLQVPYNAVLRLMKRRISAERLLCLPGQSGSSLSIGFHRWNRTNRKGLCKRNWFQRAFD